MAAILNRRYRAQRRNRMDTEKHGKQADHVVTDELTKCEVIDHEATGARVGIARCGEPLSGRAVPAVIESGNAATTGE